MSLPLSITQDYSDALLEMLRAPQEMRLTNTLNKIADANKVDLEDAKNRANSVEIVEFPPDWAPWI